MIAAAVVLPAVVGWLSTRMVDASERPRAAGGLLRAIARGYPYTLGLALSLITMTVFAPIMKIRNAFRAIGRRACPRDPERAAHGDPGLPDVGQGGQRGRGQPARDLAGHGGRSTDTVREARELLTPPPRPSPSPTEGLRRQLDRWRAHRSRGRLERFLKRAA